MQSLIVAVVVLACCVYSAWTLMPTALRRPVARLLIRNRWLASQAALQRAAKAADSGCACDGCDKGAHAPPRATATPAGAGVSVIRIVRQKRN